MKKMFLFGGLGLAMFLTACDKDNDNDNNQMNSTDQMFVTQVSISNRGEVMAGQLAASKGTSQMVKDFGNHMITEHSQAQTELQAIASNMGMTLADTVDAEHRMLMMHLNSLSGYSFDTAYMNSQVKGHQKTINVFQMELNGGNNQAVRNYANSKLPHIQMHLQKADSIVRVL